MDRIDNLFLQEAKIASNQSPFNVPNVIPVDGKNHKNNQIIRWLST